VAVAVVAVGDAPVRAARVRVPVRVGEGSDQPSAVSFQPLAAES